MPRSNASSLSWNVGARHAVPLLLVLFAASPRMAWAQGDASINGVVADTTGAVAYFVQLEWADGRLINIRDFRYARYVVDGAEVDALD